MRGSLFRVRRQRLIGSKTCGNLLNGKSFDLASILREDVIIDRLAQHIMAASPDAPQTSLLYFLSGYPSDVLFRTALHMDHHKASHTRIHHME